MKNLVLYRRQNKLTTVSGYNHIWMHRIGNKKEKISYKKYFIVRVAYYEPANFEQYNIMNQSEGPSKYMMIYYGHARAEQRYFLYNGL